MIPTDRTLDVVRPAGTAHQAEPAGAAAPAPPAPRRPADADSADADHAGTEADSATEDADSAGDADLAEDDLADAEDADPADADADHAGTEADSATEDADSAADADPADPEAAATKAAATKAAATKAADSDVADSADADSDTAGTEPGGDADDAGERSGASRLRGALVPVLAVAVVVLAVLTAQLALSYQQARVRAAAELSVLAPAKTAAARILSYDYRHAEQDAAAAAALLTGAFRGQYEAVMRQQIVPQAPRQRAVVQAEVLAAGVSGVSPDGRQAVVVVFANQTVSNTATTQPRVDQVRVRLTLDRVGETWLVAKVDAL